jgi:hypothetical protein
MHEIKSIGVVSLAKFQAVIPGIIAVIFALPVLLLEGVLPMGGVTMYIGIVAFAVIGGAVSGAITAVMYNLIAAAVGGVELNIDDGV